MKNTNMDVFLDDGHGNGRLYNASAWMADIECITVTALHADAIARSERCCIPINTLNFNEKLKFGWFEK